jgi:hypothetical protein
VFVYLFPEFAHGLLAVLDGVDEGRGQIIHHYEKFINFINYSIYQLIPWIIARR